MSSVGDEYVFPYRISEQVVIPGITYRHLLIAAALARTRHSISFREDVGRLAIEDADLVLALLDKEQEEQG